MDGLKSVGKFYSPHLWKPSTTSESDQSLMEAISDSGKTDSCDKSIDARYTSR